MAIKICVRDYKFTRSTRQSQAQFDALVSFAYNLGERNLKKSALLANINAGKPVTKQNFTDYNKIRRKVVKGLTIRRNNEYTLFSSGEYR